MKEMIRILFFHYRHRTLVHHYSLRLMREGGLFIASEEEASRKQLLARQAFKMNATRAGFIADAALVGW